MHKGTEVNMYTRHSLLAPLIQPPRPQGNRWGRCLQHALVDLHSEILDARLPLWVQILSISCSFWENMAKSVC